MSTQHSRLISLSQLLYQPKQGPDQQGYLGHHIQAQLRLLLLNLSQRIIMRLSMSSRSVFLEVSAIIQSTSTALDHLKTVGSYSLKWAILVSCSRHGKMKNLHFIIIQDTIEIIIETINMGFKPERLAMHHCQQYRVACLSSLRQPAQFAKLDLLVSSLTYQKLCLLVQKFIDTQFKRFMSGAT